MKKDNQNQTETMEDGQLDARQLFLNKPTRRHYTGAGAAILLVIVLHLAAQIVFFKSENPESEITSAKIENEQSVEIKPEYEAKKSVVVEMPAPVSPIVQPQPKKIAPALPVVKKKEPRESKVERLRRAEKILTGV